MSDKRKHLGIKGEEYAANFLTENGYSIIHRNYRCKSGEIDIIARQDQTLVFLEVKARSSNLFGSPATAVTVRKQQQIARVAQEFLARENLFDTAARFDVISILFDGQKPDITHIPNAFELP